MVSRGSSQPLRGTAASVLSASWGRRPESHSPERGVEYPRPLRALSYPLEGRPPIGDSCHRSPNARCDEAYRMRCYASIPITQLARDRLVGGSHELLLIREVGASWWSATGCIGRAAGKDEDQGRGPPKFPPSFPAHQIIPPVDNISPVIF